MINKMYPFLYVEVIEISPPEMRSALGVMFNESYPVGMILIAIIAYYIREWRLLQLYISMPSFILILHMLAMPESPRWLYYSNRKNSAWKMMEEIVTPEKKRMMYVVELIDRSIDRSLKRVLFNSFNCILFYFSSTVPNGE